MKTSILIILMSTCCLGQTAKVVALPSQDAQKVSAAKTALDKAQAAWDALRRDIEQRYISDSHEEVSLTSTGIIMQGGASSLTYGGGGTVYTDSSVAVSDGFSSRELSCGRVGLGRYEASDIQACRKLLELRLKSKAEQDAEAAKEKERVANLPKTTVYTLKPGWSNGFDFSEDFHYLVPHVPAPLAAPARPRIVPTLSRRTPRQRKAGASRERRRGCVSCDSINGVSGGSSVRGM